MLTHLQNRSFMKYHKSCPSKATKRKSQLINFTQLRFFTAQNEWSEGAPAFIPRAENRGQPAKGQKQ